MHCCGFAGYFSLVPKIKTTFDRFLSADAKHYLIGHCLMDQQSKKTKSDFLQHVDRFRDAVLPFTTQSDVAPLGRLALEGHCPSLG